MPDELLEHGVPVLLRAFPACLHLLHSLATVLALALPQVARASA